MADAVYAGDLWDTSPHLQRVFPRREIFQRRVCAWLQLSREGRAESARLRRLDPERWEVVATACRPVLAREEAAVAWPRRVAPLQSGKRVGPSSSPVDQDRQPWARGNKRQQTARPLPEAEEKGSEATEHEERYNDDFVQVAKDSVWRQCVRAVTASARSLVGKVRQTVSFLGQGSVVKLPVLERWVEQVATRTWGGTDTLQDMLRCSYLFARLPSACRVENMVVYIDRAVDDPSQRHISICQEESEGECYDVSEGFIHVVEQCLRRHREGGGSDMMAFTLALMKDDGAGHANVMLINMRNHTISRFEPHGSMATERYEDVDQFFMRLLNQAASKRRWNQQYGRFTYYPPSHCCPRFGPQWLAETSIPYDAVDALVAPVSDESQLTDKQLEDRAALELHFEPSYLAKVRAEAESKTSDRELLNEVWAGGMCGVWSQMIIEMQLMHPDWDLLSLQSAMVDVFKQDPRGTSLAMWNYTLRYALDMQWIELTFKTGCVMALQRNEAPPWLRWKPSVVRLRSFGHRQLTLKDVDMIASIQALGFWLAEQQSTARGSSAP